MERLIINLFPLYCCKDFIEVIMAAAGVLYKHGCSVACSAGKDPGAEAGKF